jgi:hypothetical protein
MVNLLIQSQMSHVPADPERCCWVLMAVMTQQQATAAVGTPS